MDGARDINRRRLLAGLSTGALSGIAGCGGIFSALGCGANGYQIDGEAFSLTQFPQIPLKPMENDPPDLVANFELPSGAGVKRRMSSDLLVVSMSYGCENKPEGRGCACSTLTLNLDYGGGSYPRPLVPGENRPPGTYYQATDWTIEYDGEQIHVWRATEAWESDRNSVSSSPSIELMVALPYDAGDETLYAETALMTRVGLHPQLSAEMPEARGAVEEGSYRVLNGATPDSSVDRSDADRKSGRTPNEG
jgi:hypothetical protein